MNFFMNLYLHLKIRTRIILLCACYSFCIVVAVIVGRSFSAPLAAISTAVFVLLGIIFSSLLYTTVNEALQRIISYLTRLTEGDLKHPIVAKRNNEISNIIFSINSLQTTMRNIVGKFQLDEILSERETINAEITKILDTYTEAWGVVVNSVEIKDIELPDNMRRAIAKQAEAEREKRAKIISAEGEFLSAQKLADTADIMMHHPIALQLRNLQTLAEIAVEKNSTIIFPAQFMSTVKEAMGIIKDDTLTK